MHHDIDPKHLRPYLGWRPLPLIKKTLMKTAQMAKMIIRYPLRRHVKARLLQLYATRIDEVVSTNLLFAKCKIIYYGYTAAQVFYGIKSYTVYIYGIKHKRKFSRVYKDFIRDHGAPLA